jgi:hypothetical protein
MIAPIALYIQGQVCVDLSVLGQSRERAVARTEWTVYKCAPNQ